MADYVLVHGAWHGAWAWRKILPGLWAAGHRAFAVDLTGLGARRHLFRPDIGLADHARDVIETIEAEELEAAILVGHSYGGMVITAVADKMAHRLSQLVYVDAAVPHSGESWSSTHSPAVRQARRDMIARLGGITPANPADWGLEGEDCAWVARRQTLHPGAPYDEVLHFDSARVGALRRCFIDFHQPALGTIASSRLRARQQGGWEIETIATGHDGMVSAAPELLAALLRRAEPPPV